MKRNVKIIDKFKCNTIKLALGYLLGDLIMVALLIFTPDLRTPEITLLVLMCIAYSIYVVYKEIKLLRCYNEL